jgi:multiple RNA-binding domain-containing protein 1
LGRILIPPAQTIAVVEYIHPTEARSAFKYLAYRRFGDAPIYLEKAPINVFRADAPTNTTKPASEPKLDSKTQITDQVMGSETTNAEDLETSTVFVKNLNFDTTVANLRKVFEPVGNVKSCTIKTKPDPKRPGKTLSLGFGFVDFSSRESALKALQTLQGFNLDGHSLVLKQGKTDLSKSITSKQEKSTKGTKLIVKNIPFEATKKEIKELFGTFGQLKSVRLPTKFSGGHRGFAFLEFTTSQEAKNVLDQVSNTHLYGRHLVLGWAQEDEGVDELRKKTGRLFDKVKGGEESKNKKRRIDMDGEGDKMDEDEF